MGDSPIMHKISKMFETYLYKVRKCQKLFLKEIKTSIILNKIMTKNSIEFTNN